MRLVAGALAILVVVAVAQAATFNDDDYHEYILYTVDTADMDILIVPPASPYYARDLVNIEKSVQMWIDGIQEIGSPWLADGLDIEYYTLGYDTPPAEVLADPEIIIFTAEYNPVLLLGVGLENPVSVCHNVDPFESAEFHQHEGSAWGSLAQECRGGGYQCLVVNTNFLSTPTDRNERQMFDLNSHELGHCLGIGHVGDALDFSANNFPRDDIMSYQFDADHVHCVSSLNIKALEAVYGDLLDHSEVYQPGGTFVHMDPKDYHQSDCQNPDNPIWTDVVSAVPIIG